MKKFICLLLSAACLAAAQFSNAQQPPQKKTVAVVKISATDAAKKLAEAQGGGLSLQSVSESLESNIVSALQNSRKFQILTRSDLPEAMKEADFANSGNSAGSKNFSFKGADYILTVKINDFQDYIKTANFALLGKSAQKRMLRLNAVANIIDSSTGAVVESANLEVFCRRELLRAWAATPGLGWSFRGLRSRDLKYKPGVAAQALKSSRRQNCRARHRSGFPRKSGGKNRLHRHCQPRRRHLYKSGRHLRRLCALGGFDRSRHGRELGLRGNCSRESRNYCNSPKILPGARNKG